MSLKKESLTINLADDGGTMKFAAAGAETAEDTVGTGGAEATDEAAATEGEAAATDEAAATEGEAEVPEDTTGLVGGIWQWAEFSDPVDGIIVIESPELYTVEFMTDDTVNVQADCNSGRGNYTADGSNITISDLAMTRALCEEGSLSDDFVNYLTAAAIYFFEDVDPLL